MEGDALLYGPQWQSERADVKRIVGDLVYYSVSGHVIHRDSLARWRELMESADVLHSHPRIIGLAGRKGSGKDTAANFLTNHGYQRIGFADALREDIEGLLINRDHGSDGGIVHAIRREPEVFEAWQLCSAADVWSKPTANHMRIVLQWYGQHKRQFDPLYWINRVEERIGLGRWAISDVRPDAVGCLEPQMIRRHGGIVVLITGRGEEGGGIEGHITERVDLIEPDVVINNAGSLAELEAKLSSLILGKTNE